MTLSQKLSQMKTLHAGRCLKLSVMVTSVIESVMCCLLKCDVIQYKYYLKCVSDKQIQTDSSLPSDHTINRCVLHTLSKMG